MRRAVHRISGCLAVLPCMAACVPGAWGPRDLVAPGAAYDFDWRLSGAQAVAPLQVFDDGRRTWLHFAPGQPVPAIFVAGREGERPVPYRRRDPYVVIEGVWPALVMRGGHLRAVARRGGQAFDEIGAYADITRTAHTGLTPARSLHAGSIDAGSTHTDAVHANSMHADSMHADSVHAVPMHGNSTRRNPMHGDPAYGNPMHANPGHAISMQAGARPLAKPAAAGAPGGAMPHGAAARPGATPVFNAEMTDGNLRRVLVRWAGLAGWTFGPEHWDVDVDIPLAGTASFGDDFKPAVRALVGATEMAERPLQPCFYANRVLRVVPLAQVCDRAAPGEAAT